MRISWGRVPMAFAERAPLRTLSQGQASKAASTAASSCEENSNWRKTCTFSCNCSTRLAPIRAEPITGFRNTQAQAIGANDCCRDWAMAWRRGKTATTSGITRDAFNVPCGWAALDADGMPAGIGR